MNHLPWSRRLVKMSECPVCFREVPLARIVPCNHEMCPRCFRQHLLNSTACPMCRGIICGSNPSLLEYEATPMRAYLTYSRSHVDGSFGFYVKEEQDRIYVTRVVPQSLAHHIGLRKGQEVLSINGLPCCRKKAIVDVMSKAHDIRMWVQSPINVSIIVPQQPNVRLRFSHFLQSLVK